MGPPHSTTIPIQNINIPLPNIPTIPTILLLLVEIEIEQCVDVACDVQEMRRGEMAATVLELMRAVLRCVRNVDRQDQLQLVVVVVGIISIIIVVVIVCFYLNDEVTS